ncbi:Probable protein phosphatase 2C 80 [Linum perenne]
MSIVAFSHRKTNTKTTPIMRMTASAFYTAKHHRNGIPKHRTEDCHFIYHEPNGHGATVIGVADGVGSGRRRGIDPGEYSEELMLNVVTALYLHDSDSSSSSDVDPLKILKSAHSQTKKPGSSTACVIALVGNELRFANIGDSGFKVFRNDSLAYGSPIQQLGFNHPAQLNARSWMLVKGGPVEGSVKVEDGDIVVAGTDGLFDNLYCWEIERILEGRSDWTAEDLARVIGLTAFENSVNEMYRSPFEQECRKHRKKFRGGKRDDITVVVGLIEQLPDFTAAS